MTDAIAITCQGVSKRFSLEQSKSVWRTAFGHRDGAAFDALKNVSFSVSKGKFVGILGRNGAGKSTLLRVLGGVYSADEGQVSVNGMLSGLYELGLAANPELTGRAYAERLLTVHGFSAERQAVMITDAHEFSELGDRFDDPVYTYSAGMAARLFFSVATAGDYEVYLIDEVLSVGDQNFQSKCWRRLRDRVSNGASGVLVTHDWSAILRLCETTHVLQNGQVIFSGPSEKAVRHYLYGPEAKETYVSEIAQLVGEPEFPEDITQGDAFTVGITAEVMQEADLHVSIALERLQPGFGWETSMMTRKPEPIGRGKGRHRIEMSWDHLALSSGDYRVAVGLMIPDAELPGRYTACDARSWMNGDRAAFRVHGSKQTLALRAQWSLSTGEEAGR